MRNSNRFKEMNSRLEELRDHLLPPEFSKTGDYTELQRDQSRGYRLLAHAEIESYLEDIARTVVNAAIKVWKSKGESTKQLIAFLACYHSGWIASDDVHNDHIVEVAKSRKKSIADSVNDIIDQAHRQFINRVKNNHGIKEENFLLLIQPTGIDKKDLDQTWIANLDSFGKLRGAVAHSKKSVTEAINPEDEYLKVSELLKGLNDLDSLIVHSHTSNLAFESIKI